MTPAYEQQMHQHQDACLTAVTGDVAPISGWWRPDGDPAPFRYREQGDIMPRLDGKRATWTLVFDIAPADRAQVRKWRP